MRTGLLVAVIMAGCGGGGVSEIVCGEGDKAAIKAGETLFIEKKEAMDLRGAAITLPKSGAERMVSIACTDSIASSNHSDVGPAVSFASSYWRETEPVNYQLPFKSDRVPNDETRHLQIAFRGVNQSDARIIPANNLLVDETAGVVTFSAYEPGTYQVVTAQNATTERQRRFAYRAIIGVSMGGDAALSLGLRNPEKFDLVATLGGEPGPDKALALRTLHEYTFGGFCTAADEAAGRGDVGTLCLDEQRPPRSEQFEITADFEHFVYQDGLGVGLTLTRDLYMRASRDLSRAYGNPTLYNPQNPFLPPGVPEDYPQRTREDQCQNPIILSDFYDRNYNPAGDKSVITVCDGGDAPGARGVFDPNQPQTNPWQILLAVDLNGNNVRDAGEPIIVQHSEPWQDVGVDNTADEDETGPLGAYDAVANPDPAGDNYHYLHNPSGTEGNDRYDAGEDFEDVGLDGVACPGNCPYDFGEGDGTYTLNPNVARWYEYSLQEMYAALTPEQRANTSFWFDAGIRDFLNAHLAVNSGAGYLASQQRNVRLLEGFHYLSGAPDEKLYDFSEVDWQTLPENVYLRYGDPQASQADIDNGDGRHVGTATQLINRVTTAFGWISHNWPNGDRESDVGAGMIEQNLVFTSPTVGRDTPYGLFLPPGYNDPENADKRYPVVFFLHGYGQQPSDLVTISSIFENFMITSEFDETQRFQKFIIVYFDGLCRPKTNEVPVDPNGDGCERGTFYLDSPSSDKAQLETILLELMDHIDATYRTKQPETVTWRP